MAEEQKKETWMDKWRNFAPQYGKWKIDRRFAEPLIQTLIDEERLNAAEEAYEKSKKVYGEITEPGLIQIRKQAAEEMLKAVTQKKHWYDSFEHEDREECIVWNNCRSEVIRKGEEFISKM